MKSLHIADRAIGPSEPVFVIAEISANHNQSFDRAVELVRVAAEAGADAVKLQTYTADTLTINCDRELFRIGPGSPWSGRTLYDLYQEAHTPWDWQPQLKAVADDIGIPLFSTPFDPTAVDFLETMDVPAYKIASFEIVDTPLIARVAATGKPIIMSTGMATLSEVAEAVQVARDSGCEDLALLKCTSSYPAPPEEANLKTIRHLSDAFGVITGLSDHTLGIAVPVAAVALGARIIEKHFTLSRKDAGPDSAFSLEPDEFAAMVEAVRITESATGEVSYVRTPKELASFQFRRSLFAVQDIKAGERFTPDNVRSIRPGQGLPPKFTNLVFESTASQVVKRGTPLGWHHLVSHPEGPTSD